MILKGKQIILGVTGSIAAYKIASLASALVQKGADVTVIMTKNATNIINPITFESLTGNKCLTETFDTNFRHDIKHVSLAEKADCFLIAPATANVIGKAANGIADDMLTTTIFACDCTKIVSPAMNTRMYKNPVMQDNIKKLEGYGFWIIPPDSGYLACGDTGEGKMPAPEVLMEFIIKAVTKKDLAGKKILVTAGPTRESLDPVRFISNHSTGKMGYAIARAAMMRGAEVTLVSGPVSLKSPIDVKFVPVESAAEMAEAVKAAAAEQDIIIKAAAVADYRPAFTAENKMKKKDEEMSVALERTEDILGYLGAHKKEGQILCGFSMETENLIENSKAKLVKKNLDLIVANNLKTPGAGFGTDTNVVTFITENEIKELPLCSKEEVADRLLDMIVKT